MSPGVSLIVGCFNMARELPRTVRSLSPAMQRGVERSDYEIIVADNGSSVPLDERTCNQWGADIRVLRFESGQPSPVVALNAAVNVARGRMIGMMIDGARIASPGIIAWALKADALITRAIVATLGFHLGPAAQQESVLRGYDQNEEDRLLERANWHEDGYRLFDISVLAASSRAGWFRPIAESGALFMRRELWNEVGGFDEQFRSPGGGLANLDLFERAIGLPDTAIVTLLGEGTFHQVHGGIATNAANSPFASFDAEYQAIRGRSYRAPQYRSFYLGTMPQNALRFVDPTPSMRSI